MSRRRFETLTAAFCLHDPDDTNDDPWFPVRDFICAFNKRRNDVVHAGTYLCVDESMVQWYGTEAKNHHLGLPHKTKIPRKPMSQGAEIKTIADAESGVLGKLRQRGKQFTHQFGEGTAITLRLTSPFYGSRRIVVGDSAFASVKTLIELERRGLYFMGLAKTASSGYPKQHMVQWSATARRDDSYVMRSESPLMYALCWSDRNPKCIIANRGTTAPGNDSIRTRHKIVRHGDGTSETVRFTLQVPVSICIVTSHTILSMLCFRFASFRSTRKREKTTAVRSENARCAAKSALSSAPRGRFQRRTTSFRSVARSQSVSAMRNTWHKQNELQNANASHGKFFVLYGYRYAQHLPPVVFVGGRMMI
ncbi:TPA: hypothetical protein N0F65_001380 [Lagenidium giganteum]|uniref:PiggyBac transposable element-derived protein domain-containing protein n=1 Tax=Lagenidium giganteum TaxID=4803 RepID=A0AAV2YX60_9STRA|nr:TPA: hypothetical protein N0F65_001380 [Lagenidium giganteum]